MSSFRVIAIHTRDGRTERREVDQCSTVIEAFERFGYHASRTNGVLVVDENGDVWAEYRPAQIERPTEEQRLRYQLFMDSETSLRTA